MSLHLLYDPVCIPVGRKRDILVNPIHIEHVCSSGRYCDVYFEDGRVQRGVSLTISQFEELLPGDLFCRTHRCYIVATHHVKEIDYEMSLLIFSRGHHAVLSKNCEAQFFARIRKVMK